jgi:hypothetical protein
MRHDITELFCFVDDFCKVLNDEFSRHQLSGTTKKPTRVPGLSNSEIVTILLMFQTSKMKTFKYFYNDYMPFYRDEFPQLPSYDRFIALQSRVVQIITIFFLCLRNKNADIAFIDSTPIRVCHNKRIFNHRVFDGLAARGKSTMGWFFGFKLHLAIDPEGNIINSQLTPGNVNDLKPVEDLVADFHGLLLGDRGYICQELFQKLFEKGVKFVTGIKKNMKNILMDLKEKMLLRKRSIIETVFGYMKQTMMLEHSRHRSSKNFLIHLLSTLVAYQLKHTKPTIAPLLQEIS